MECVPGHNDTFILAAHEECLSSALCCKCRSKNKNEEVLSLFLLIFCEYKSDDDDNNER